MEVEKDEKSEIEESYISDYDEYNIEDGLIESEKKSRIDLDKKKGQKYIK